MATTLENTLIRFNDGTTQSTAATTPPAASTSVAGIVQLTTSTSSTSTTLAATASAVKAAYDLAASKAAASHTHSYVPNDVAHNSVGEFCLVSWPLGRTADQAGKTIAGSWLYAASSSAKYYSATPLSGTWRLHGYAPTGNSGERLPVIAQRIS